MKQNHNKTYTCDRCGKTAESGWTEEEALEESTKQWGSMSVEDMAIVCDDCYKEFMKFYNSQEGKI